jgi:dipeptidyl aminopeptidase/acylaminoacyl peptidase
VVAGEPAVVGPVGFDTSIDRGAFAVSENGVLAYRTGIAERRQLIWVDRAGKVLGSFGPADDAGMAAPELSVDGQSVAVFRTMIGNSDIWLLRQENVLSRFTFRDDLDMNPVWSADGQRIYFTTVNPDTTIAITQKAANGDTDGVQLTQSSAIQIPLDISRDGQLLLYSTQVPKTGVDLWALPLAGDHKPFVVVQTEFDEMAGQISPDGHWVAYQSNASGRMEVYVRSFPGAGSQMQVSASGGSQVRWRPDGTELYFVAADGHMMASATRAAADGRNFQFEPAKPLFQVRLAHGANVPPAVATKQQYAVSSDGRFLINAQVEGSPFPPITVAVNWPSGR